MIRLARMVALGAVPLATAVLALFAALAAPAPAGVGPVVPAVASPSPSQSPSASPSPSRPPSASSSPVCVGCVTAQDAICWERQCPVPLIVTTPVTHPITIYYRTVAMTAKPMLDFVPVQGGTLTIPAGQTGASIVLTLLPRPGAPERRFAVAFDGIVGGQLTRPQAIVTIMASSPSS